MDELISIIVPVYNVEKYLDKCIQSILDQVYANLEIIIINDGSKDTSGEICDKYAKKDKRIKVIHQPNKGLSAARNAGIEIATGKYIGFVDSDDYIEKDMYKFLYDLIQKNNADVSICERYIAYENGKIKKNKNDEILKIMDNKEALIALNTFVFDMAVWDKLYDIKLFKDIRFPIGKLNEDYYVMHELLYKANKVVYNSIPKYYYFQRENSLSRSKEIKLGLIEASYEQIEFFEKNFKEGVYIARAYQAFNSIATYNEYLKYNYKCDKQKKKEFKGLVKKNIKDVLKNKYLPNIKKFQAILFITNLKLYEIAYKKTL